MTAVLAISVREGVVLTTDSRTTIRQSDDAGAVQTFDGVQKLFLLHPDVPFAVMSWGLNIIGGSTVGELIEDISDRLSGRSAKHKDWEIDPDKFQLKEVAERVTNALFHEHYQPFSETVPSVPNCTLHFAGFSKGRKTPELSEAVFVKDHIQGPKHLINTAVQVNYTGTYTSRIMTAMDPRILPLLERAGLNNDKAKQATQQLAKEALRRLVHPSMPLREAANLSRILMNTEIALTRFGPEPDVVGGGIQMAVINSAGCQMMNFPAEHLVVSK